MQGNGIGSSGDVERAFSVIARATSSPILANNHYIALRIIKYHQVELGVN